MMWACSCINIYVGLSLSADSQAVSQLWSVGLDLWSQPPDGGILKVFGVEPKPAAVSERVKIQQESVCVFSLSAEALQENEEGRLSLTSISINTSRLSRLVCRSDNVNPTSFLCTLTAWPICLLLFFMHYFLRQHRTWQIVGGSSRGAEMFLQPGAESLPGTSPSTRSSESKLDSFRLHQPRIFVLQGHV